MTDLDKLIAAVEDSSSEINWKEVAGYSWAKWGYCERAFGGSLDAAWALHEALLPGYRWSIQGDTGHASVWGEDSDGAHTDPSNPARSWLLAILKAYRSLQ